MNARHLLPPFIAALALRLIGACASDPEDFSVQDAESDSDESLEGGGDASADVFAVEADALSMDAPLDAQSGCRRVAHIGDSLTFYPLAELQALYAARGFVAEISAHGGRTVTGKRSDDTLTGIQAATGLKSRGPWDCWVIALGTNDAASVANGTAPGRTARIDTMMETIDPTKTARILWVNTFTTLTTGIYQNANMKLWNQELVDAKARWPNLRIYDWATVAAGGTAPFTDGVHHTTAGYTVRNQATLQALAATFP